MDSSAQCPCPHKRCAPALAQPLPPSKKTSVALLAPPVEDKNIGFFFRNWLNDCCRAWRTTPPKCRYSSPRAASVAGLGQSFARGPRGRDDMAGALVAQVVRAKKNRQGRRGRRNSKRRTGKVVACGGTCVTRDEAGTGAAFLSRAGRHRFLPPTGTGHGRRQRWADVRPAEPHTDRRGGEPLLNVGRPPAIASIGRPRYSLAILCGPRLGNVRASHRGSQALFSPCVLGQLDVRRLPTRG
jgi:hypothetical protein